jgi:PKD repeat protein
VNPILVSWLWDFGDGQESAEQFPVHSYKNPGKYTVTLTAVDDSGIVYTHAEVYYVYVYEYAETLRPGPTDFCIRHAVKPSQGCGITPFGGRWVWPMPVGYTAKGYNDDHEPINLVINAKTMEIFQIGIPELWVDREGGYDESEIACEAMLPEIVSRNGEHENVRHIETHVSQRSWDELNYRGASGYAADGFRGDHKLSLEAYSAGEQIVPTTVLSSVQRNGDYAFLKEVEARRIQLKLKYSTSAFRTTKIEAHCQEIDKRTPPQFNVTPEKLWQKEFSGPDIWFSRNKPAMNINRGDGSVWSGSGVAVSGPDGKSKSAIDSASGFYGITLFTIADFTISGWMFGDGRLVVIFDPTPAIALIVAVSSGNFNCIHGVETISAPLSGSGWIFLTVVRRGNEIELYENGRLKTFAQIVTIISLGGHSYVGPTSTVFDVRRYPKAISGAAILSYYNSVLAGGGGYLP